MKKILNRHNIEPCILHLPGDGLKKFEPQIQYLKNKEFEVKNKSKLLFLTICTTNIESPLIYQLKKNNLTYVNLVDYIKDDILKFSTKWNWMYKHIALKRFLEKNKDIDEETVILLLDARDIYLNNIDNIYNLFITKYWNRILFCGSKSDYPNSIGEGDDYKKINTVKSTFPVFLNAGGIIAKKWQIEKLVDKILECNKTGYCDTYKLKKQLIDDDQYICKVIQQYVPKEFNHYELLIDDMCDFFQVLCLNKLVDEQTHFICT